MLKKKGPLSPEQELALLKLKGRLKDVLIQHPGEARAISMVNCYREVFGREPRSKINGTRELRDLITICQEEGYPIGTSQKSTGGGIYLMVTESEKHAHYRKIVGREIRIMKRLGAMMQQSDEEILNGMLANLKAEEENR